MEREHERKRKERLKDADDKRESQKKIQMSDYTHEELR